MNASRPTPMHRRDFLKETVAVTTALGLSHRVFAAEDSEPRIPDGKRLKVGLIGCGNVSGSYLPHITKQPFIEVVAVCDIIPSRAENRAKQFKVPNVYPNIDEMLRGVPFDLLVNTTSMPSHFPVNEKALNAKRHVWSEKPMALTLKDARHLLDLAKRNGVHIWPAPTCVTSPQFKFMAETIASGRIGKATVGRGTYGHGGVSWSGWFYEKGGGSLYDLGVYNVTTLTGLLGPAKAVVGMTTIVNPTRKVEDRGEVKVTADENTMLIMDHGNGVLSHVQTGFVQFDNYRLPGRERQLYTVDIIGTKGAMHMQGWDWGPAGVDLAHEGENVLETQVKEPGRYNWVGGATYVAECLLTNKTSLITPEHGLHVLEVMNACHESQRTGRRVAIETSFRWPLFG
ncbi:MAG: Gfo/Idh/MocA family oxidoreductase [Verrucomicrobiales bacterium]|nr:Gfo/Idh/MocA family oxidoreductase [Verrucomicrobiales bacterium]